MEKIISLYNNVYTIDIIVDFIKIFFICITTYYTSFKISNHKFELNNFLFLEGFCIVIISILVTIAKYKLEFFMYIISICTLLGWIYSIKTKDSAGYSILITIISLSFNYILFVISIIISFIINIFFVTIKNDFLNLAIMMCLQILLLMCTFKIKKFKHGISFLKNNSKEDYFNLIMLTIAISIIFSIIIFSNIELAISRNMFIGFIIFAIIMFITIQKSLQLYYKQKLLVQELEKTKKELSEKTKEIENLEAENIAISKKAHTLDHKQKSLAKKIDEMIMNTEINKEEVAEVKERLNKIGQELYKEKTAVELSKTEISEIDDMLNYMKSECSANKIDFELQIKGNIHYMTNNLITIEDLETLLADHIKNAIIAINHTDNVNRSILVRVGKIDEIYSLYIYDSGIEFSKETLENLGKKPSTTYADEGGTGMGFMNTFDTLRKCKASLIIEELNEPCKDNYTKAIIIKFDNKNEFKIIYKK